MREHLSKFIIVGLLALIVGVPLLMRGRSESKAASTDGATGRLIIYSPHNEQIRYEFAAGFNRHREAKGLLPIEFDWRSSGGTSDLRKQILSQYEAVIKDAKSLEEADALIDKGIGADIFFGGGEYEHNAINRKVEFEGKKLPLSRAANLPDGLLAEAFPSGTIGGERLYHEDRLWVGTTLSSFGIVYNTDVLQMKGMPIPTTWSDLADPRLIGEIALADPGHSGSITATYETIIRRVGWNEGWALLRRSFANSRYFSSASSKVPVDISAGEAAAGMCIDFYGRFQAGAVAKADGTSRVGYVDPPGLTATTADPISILRGAPSPGLADAFVAWTLSVDAQKLWQYKVGAPGGPTTFELRRQPIRVELYDPGHKTHYTDPEIDPFAHAKPIPEGVPTYYGYISTIAYAIGIGNHDHLKAAWEAIQSTDPSHPNYEKMITLFDQMPPELVVVWPTDLDADWLTILRDDDHPRRQEVVDTLVRFEHTLKQRWRGKDKKEKDRLAWTKYFRKNYKEIVVLAGE